MIVNWSEGVFSRQDIECTADSDSSELQTAVILMLTHKKPHAVVVRK